MFSFKSVYFVIFTLISHLVLGEISDKRLCIDKNCSVPISRGITLIKYSSPEENVLSFTPNESVIVYSYGAGTRPDLIGVEIRGKRGYVNKNHIRESGLLKRPTLTLDTEIVKKPEPYIEVPQKEEIKAAPTHEAYEIVDGTKIPIDVVTSTTEAPIQKVEEKQSSGEETTPLNIESTKIIEQVVQKSTEQPPQPIVNNLAEDKAKDIPDKENVVNKEEDEDNEDDGDVEDGDEDDDDADEGEETKSEAEVKQPEQQDTISENVQNSEIPEKVIEQPKPVITENKQPEVLQTSGDSAVPMTPPEVPVIQNLTENSPKTAEVPNADSPPKVPSEVPDLPLEKIVTQEKSSDNPAQDSIIVPQKPITVPQVTEEVGMETPTEIPLENELFPAEDFETVTPDPAKSTTVELKEEIKVETPAEGGLGGIFSMFSSGAEDDKPAEKEDVVEEIKTDAPELAVEMKQPEEEAAESGGLFSMFGSAPEVPEPTEEIKVDDEVASIEPNPVSEEVEVPVENNDIVSTNGSDLKLEEIVPKLDEPAVVVPVEVLHKEEPIGKIGEIEPIVEESAPEKNDFSFEQPQREDVNVVPPPVVTESDLKENQADNSHSGSGAILSSISSFFGMNGDGQNDSFDEKSSDGLAPNNLVENGGEVANNSQMDSGELNDPQAIPPQSVPQPEEFCDSKSEKCPQIAKQGFCDKESQDCPSEEHVVMQPATDFKTINSADLEEIFMTAFSSDLFLYLTTTALSVLILIFVWALLEKCRREGPLIARINKLEQQLLATSKENAMLQERAATVVEEKGQLVVETVPNEVLEELNRKITDLTHEKLALEEQIGALEKELDNSTEMGMELNKIISEMLSSTDGSEILRENIEQMQKKVLEQQDTINSLNDNVSVKETEIHEIRLELDISNRKVGDLQGEVDKMVEKILKIEEEKEQQHGALEAELASYRDKCKQALSQEHNLKTEIITLKQSAAELQRTADVKVKEYNTLKDTLSKIKSMNNDKEKIKSFLDITETKARLEQMKSENLKYSQQLSLEKEANVTYSAQIETLLIEVKELREKYEQSDKQKVEINTKLEVLNNYFKEKEEQLQKEISKYESLWAAKEGEATSTTERLRYMQEELQNYKAQNESLKQEIMNQEVELKSQISMLEKKSHENWVANRQTERKLEEARQEAAQLRNRLTMRERAFAEGNNHMRMQSPLHQNGELPLSPPPLDPTQSPPPLFNPRDHITKSPPIPGLPPPPFLPLGAGHFLPPPPLDGMMPPPMGDMGLPPPPFMPGLHHPGMFPGDHRPPPLGRMSSPPPVGGRYTPESTVYSEYDRYDRRSPSPPYDSEYGASPPPMRGYSPYDDRGDRDRHRDDRREYKRPQPRSNGRHPKGMHSSGSENDSLGKLSKKPQRKV